MGNQTLRCSAEKILDYPQFQKIKEKASPNYRHFLDSISDQPLSPDLQHSQALLAGSWGESEQKSGQGIIYNPKSFYYEGDILQGKANGTGRMLFQKSKQAQYVGDFEQNQAHGQGEFSSQSHQFCLKGKWEHGKPLENEPMSLILNKEMSEITFLSNKGPEIKAKIKFHNQMTYFGTLVMKDSIVLTGTGQMRFPDQSIYVGDFKDGAMHGIGRYTWKNGDIYEGNYQYNKRQGKGLYTSADGQAISGVWHNGELNQSAILQ